VQETAPPHVTCYLNLQRMKEPAAGSPMRCGSAMLQAHPKKGSRRIRGFFTARLDCKAMKPLVNNGLVVVKRRYQPFEKNSRSEGASELRRDEPRHVGWANASE